MPHKDPDRKREYGRLWARKNQAKMAASNRKWLAANPTKTTEYCRRYRAKLGSAGNRERKLRRKFGIDLAVVDEMLLAQGGACAICGTRDAGRASWPVDHCHANGRVRGLLCHKCNSGLGMFNDNVAALRTAADYVEFHKLIG